MKSVKLRGSFNRVWSAMTEEKCLDLLKDIVLEVGKKISNKAQLEAVSHFYDVRSSISISHGKMHIEDERVHDRKLQKDDTDWSAKPDSEKINTLVRGYRSSLLINESITTIECDPKMDCPDCNGTGACPTCGGTKKVTCPVCVGSTECPSCDGTGKYTCENCGGSGDCPVCDDDCQVECENCLGSGVVLCWDCDGTGEYTNPYNGRKSKCRKCGGTGEYTCNSCWGSGYLDCPVCHGKGKCRHCHGKGYHVCKACHGSGTCGKCKGKGEVRCPDCNGKGGCSRCAGTGKVVCSTCYGTGYYQTYQVYKLLQYEKEDYDLKSQNVFRSLEKDALLLAKADKELLYNDIACINYNNQIIYNDLKTALLKIPVEEKRRIIKLLNLETKGDSVLRKPKGKDLYEVINILLRRMPVTKLTYVVPGLISGRRYSYDIYIIGYNNVVLYDKLPTKSFFKLRL